MRLLFFIGSLKSGGKERRLVELLSYLKKKNRFEIIVVLTSNEIEYPKFYDSDVKFLILNKDRKNKYSDIVAILKLGKIVSGFKPDIIHTWGIKQTLQAVPIAKLYNIPLVNSQITSAPPQLRESLLAKLSRYVSFKYSTFILANSFAGLQRFGVDSLSNAQVIYNGMDMDRFINLTDIQSIKKRFNITTAYVVVMVASYSISKDYIRFVNLAKYVTSRINDVSFIGVGGQDPDIYKRVKELAGSNERIVLHGPIDNVEELVNASDIGVLFTASGHGEGISNSILEYMALGKPAVVDKCGGNEELIVEGQNGYFTADRSIEETGNQIIDLLYNTELRFSMGSKSKELVTSIFTLDQMGKRFEEVYEKVLNIHEN
jgi:glycosyltransferase involved in cell wall biosynthesis